VPRDADHRDDLIRQEGADIRVRREGFQLHGLWTAGSNERLSGLCLAASAREGDNPSGARVR
jgi:hypothetical protein